MRPVSLRRRLAAALALAVLIPLLTLVTATLVQYQEVRKQTAERLRDSTFAISTALENEISRAQIALESAALAISRGDRDELAGEALGHLLYVASRINADTVLLDDAGRLLGHSISTSTGIAAKISADAPSFWGFRETLRKGRANYAYIGRKSGGPLVAIVVPIPEPRSQVKVMRVLISLLALEPLFNAVSADYLQTDATLRLLDAKNEELVRIGPMAAEYAVSAQSVMNGTGWRIEESLPEAALFTRADIFALIGILTGIFVSIFYFFAARMHFRHLDAFFAELADNITRLRDGKPSTTSTGALAGAPEAEAILEKFRAMADSLARSREEITRINAGLEARVKERTAESRRKSAGLSAVFLSMTEGFLLFSPTRGVLFTNSRFQDFLSSLPRDSAAAEFARPGIESRYLRIPGILQEAFSRLNEDILVKPGEAEGRVYLLRAFSVDLPEGDGPGGTAVIVRDVTREHEVQALKDDVIGLASHELNNPVASICLGLETLTRRGDKLTPEMRSRLCETLHGEARRLQMLIRDWLDISMLNNGTLAYHRAEIDLTEVIRSTCELWHDSHPKVVLETRLPAEKVMADADADRIRQVFLNLLENGLRYNDKPEVRLKVVMAVKDGSAAISFSDNGIGITPAESEHIFERFWRGERASRRSPSGSGLGLSICRTIMRAHGGEITAEAGEPGAGTTLRVTMSIIGVIPPA